MLVAKRLQIGEVGYIRAFLNTHVYSGDLEPRHEDLRPAAEQLDQSQGVLAATEGNEDVIALLDERVVGTSLVEPLGEAGLKFGEFDLLRRFHGN